jgi:hypothetical protein
MHDAGLWVLGRLPGMTGCVWFGDPAFLPEAIVSHGSMLQALLLGGTPGVAQHASIGEEALRQRRARLHAALDSAFGR